MIAFVNCSVLVDMFLTSTILIYIIYTYIIASCNISGDVPYLFMKFLDGLSFVEFSFCN